MPTTFNPHLFSFLSFILVLAFKSLLVEKQGYSLQIHEPPIEHKKTDAADSERDNERHKIIFHLGVSLSNRSKTALPKKPHR